MPKTTDTTTEEKILTAATEVFIQKGFSGARMQEIADRADINKAMLHYYFRSKEKLFRVILSRAMDEFAPTLLKSLSGNEPVLVKLETLINNHLDFLLKNPHYPLFIMHELSQNQGQFMKEMAATQQAQPVFLGFVQQVIEEGEAGTIRKVNPLHLMMNTMSMIIFPFVAKPMIGVMADVPEEAFAALFQERRQAVIEFVRAALRPE